MELSKIVLAISLWLIGSGGNVVSAFQALNLVGNKVVTYVDEEGLPSRQTEIIELGMQGVAPAVLSATTQAWYGSGLRNGTYNGYIDHYSLNDQQNDYLYSAPYMSFNLHLASKSSEIVNVRLLDQLGRMRVGIENRFANTDTIRTERSVSWARSQNFYENIRQLADKRVDFLLADKDMIEQFNKLLAEQDEELIYTSSAPIYIVEVSLAISKEIENAKDIIEKFNQSISTMRDDQKIDEILNNETKSLLNPAVYESILRKW